MWILRAARDPSLPRGVLTTPFRRLRVRRGGGLVLSLSLLATCCLLGCFGPIAAYAKPAAQPQVQVQPDELIATIRVNEVSRGEFTLLRQPDGDFWVRGDDLAVMRVDPVLQARRTVGAQTYYSVRSLGASSVTFNEAELALDLRFPAATLQGNVIDLGTRPPPTVVSQPRTSLILSYRLSTNHGQGNKTPVLLDTDLNLRVGGLLLRQTQRVATGAEYNGYIRGSTQAIWDNLPAGQRYTLGDVVSSAAQYGVGMTGAGLMLTKLYDMTPDIVKQPTATLRASTPVPAEVQVSVDGSTIYRGSVGPGPITLNNLLMYGGTRNVQVTVTDASGRREVISQPYLFTDSVLAHGLREYNYFVGRRSELGPDNAWHYEEMAWQGFHRYGVTDSLTIGAGGEGNADFTTLGGGVTLRSDLLGLASLDLIGNHDRAAGTTATGWSARYSYVTPHWSFRVGRREFEPGFRTFLTSPINPYLRQDTQLGLSFQLWNATVSGESVHSEDALGSRQSAAVRAAINLSRSTTLSAELQNSRDNYGQRDWAAYVYLRFDMDDGRWVGSTLRSTPTAKGLDLEAGKTLPQGEGVGYRFGLSENRYEPGSSGSGYATAKWNLQPLSLEFLGTSATHGDGSSYTEVAASGAIVAVDGYWGATREVDDSFALVRIGVPQPGVEVLLNNQVQGKTDGRGMLFVPNLGAFGRQDVSVNDTQVGMQYELLERRRTVTPAYRSGTVVDFGGRKLSAIAGVAWKLADGNRTPIIARAWTLTGPGGTLNVETGNTGDFYLENAVAGTYRGSIQVRDRVYSCLLTVPEFAEPVLELKEGIECE